MDIEKRINETFLKATIDERINALETIHKNSPRAKLILALVDVWTKLAVAELALENALSGKEEKES